MSKKTTIATALAALLVLALPGLASAAPVLGIASSHEPAEVPAGTHAKYELVVSNTGSEETSGAVSVEFSVPAGLEITGVVDQSAKILAEFGLPGLWECSIAGDARSVGCDGIDASGNLGGPFPIGPGEEACVGLIGPCHIFVTVKSDHDGTPGTVHPTIEACGGGAASCASTDDPLEITPGGFHLLHFDGQVLDEAGDPATQAASHPYTAATQFTISSGLGSNGIKLPVEHLQDAAAKLPSGFVGNPLAVPTCTQIQLSGYYNPGTDCPPESQVGLATVHFTPGSPVTYPVYNMERPSGSAADRGVPALFGFDVLGFAVEVYPQLRTGEDYGVTVLTKNAPQAAPFDGFDFTFWGVPADPSHDADRFCGGSSTKGCASEAPLKPLLSLPTSCVGPVETFLDVTSWEGSADGGSFLSHDNSTPTPNPIGADGCNAVDFSPSLEARPTTTVADSASGLDVDLHVPQSESCDPGPPVVCETAEAHLRDTEVTLPEGMTINPSGANGLGACSESQFGFTEMEGDAIHTTADPAACPDAAKLGTVEVDTPLVDHPLRGAVYIAEPHQNPFGSLLALYLSVDDPKTGTVVKLAGEVHADPVTGQLTTTFLHNPQLPFEDFHLHFFGGAGGSLRTPATCGTYQTTSVLTPWTAPEGNDATPSDAWQISQAPGGGTCPTSQGQIPNSPSLDAGSLTPIAAAATPTVVNLRRNDGSQEFSTLSLTLPPGLTGKLAGISACSDAALATAAGKSGREEESSPSCPTASRIGSVDVAAGAGPAPYNAKGAAYLTGHYKGAPLGMAIVTPAVAGPFDLGTVVVRVALHLDPATGQITAISDPIPHILQGIPLDVRSARVLLDRPDFTRNGTSCNPSAFNGSLTSTLGQVASLSNRFQLGECTALSFKPRLSIRLKGGTKRGAHPALTGIAQLPEGGANIAKASIALPKSEFLDQGHIGTVCTRVQFAEGAGNGAQCPAASIYGQAKATSPLVDYTLEGPVFLRSSEHELPDLVAALHGPASQPIAVDVAARIDSVKGGIRSTFEGVPDLPVSTFVLEMQGGSKGLLQNSTNICKGIHKATAELDGQNGKAADLTPVLKPKCPRAAHKRHRRHRAAKHRRAVR